MFRAHGRIASAPLRRTPCRETVGDFLVDRLHAWGVRRIFGYPGDGINGVLGALNRAKGKIEFVQARHEEMAAFMASAYAKFTGEMGVCLSTGGPGRLAPDHRPLRRQARSHAGAGDRGPGSRAPRCGGHYQQELDLDRMFKDVAGLRPGAGVAPQLRHSSIAAIASPSRERAVTR